MAITSVSQEIQQGIQRTNRAFEAAFVAGDAASAAAVYSEGGFAMPPGGPIVKGRAELRALWQGVMDMGVARVTLETLDLQTLGDGVCEVGKAVLFAKDGTVVDTVKFVVVWLQEPDGWKWHRDIWNSLGD